MKLALVVPEGKLKLNNACLPYNLACLAGYVRKELPETEIKIVDGVAHRNVWVELFEFQPDIIGITAVTPQAPAMYRLADDIRRNRHGILVVIGGVHASALPEEASRHADCVIVGEGELALVDLLRGYQVGKKELIPKIIEGKPIENLDDIPMPAYELVDVAEYLRHGPPFPNLKHPILSMMTSRGCPYRCPFCRNSGRKEKVRYHSAQRVTEEILYFLDHYNVNSIFFNDDEFLVNKNRLSKLAELFKQYGINKRIVWGCQARSNTLTKETLSTAKEMGCVVISPGFESGTQRLLNYLKCKTTTLESNEKIINLATEEGITIGGSFIFGSPGETLDEMKQTFKWFEDHELKFIGINTMIPYPGTIIWKQATFEGLLPKTIDYTKLVPTSLPSQTYIIDKAVNPEEYDKFMDFVQKMAWLYTKVRLTPTATSFFALAVHRTWWWGWLHSPKRMIKLLRKCLRRNKK